MDNYGNCPEIIDFPKNVEFCHNLEFLLIFYLVESSFIELRCKEVINVLDGRRLGHIIDIVFDLCSGRVQGFVLPGEKQGWNIFKNCNQIFLPFCSIVKIGEDTILVELPTQCPPCNPFILSQNKKEK